LNFLRICDMVDFNSSIANFWPEKRKNECLWSSLRFDTKWNRRKNTCWGGKFKKL